MRKEVSKVGTKKEKEKQEWRAEPLMKLETIRMRAVNLACSGASVHQ